MRILCFGDSNTYGYDPRSYFGGRYPAEARWVDALSQKNGYEVINAGENGREIPRRADEFQRVNQLLSEYQPIDVLIVMLGFNDLLQGAGVAEVTARMEAFMRQLPLASAKILLVAPPSMELGEWVTTERLVADSIRLAEEYKILAQRYGIQFVDAGRWNIDLTFDGVHFSTEGHRTFAENIYWALSKQS